MNTKTCGILVLAAGAALASGALAGPTTSRWAASGPAAAPGMVKTEAPATRGAPWEDDFDSYAAGSGLAGQGGWTLWPGGLDGMVSTQQADSPPHSLRLMAGTDLVQQFSVDDGVWTFSVDTYVPSGVSGLGFVILLNQYDGGGAGTNWSCQAEFDADANDVELQFNGVTTALIKDRWVEFRLEIDLDNDRWDAFYDGVQFGFDLIWTQNMFAGGDGITSIAALDAFSSTLTPFYYDNASLQPLESCAVDLNGDGAVTIADFLEFLNLFAAGDARAEFDGNPGITVGDFLAFLNAFAVGC